MFRPLARLPKADLRLESLERRDTPATTWDVNTTGDLPDANLNDGVPADANGNVSLRAAVQQANANGGDYIIQFLQLAPPNLGGINDPPSPPPPPPVMSIGLTHAMDPFTANIAVDGPGWAQVEIIGGSDHAGMFTITGSSTSSFSGVRLSGGVNIANDGGSGQGGAIDNQGSLTLTGVKIDGCQADFGGAITNATQLTVRGCELVGNTAMGGAGFGGAISAIGTSATLVQSSLIQGNLAAGGARGGGIAIQLRSQVTLQGTDVTYNQAFAGGGVYVSGGTFLMTDGSVSNNTSATTGGGIQHSGGTSSLENVTIQGNSADSGPGYYRGGGIFIGSPGFSMNGGVIEDNQAGDGGGIAQVGGSSTFTGVTVQDNFASNWGGGVYVSGGDLTLTTCTFAGNGGAAGAPKIARATQPGNPAPTVNVAPDCVGVTADDVVDVPYDN